MRRNQSSAVAYLTLGRSVRESRLMVDRVNTVVIPRPTRSDVALKYNYSKT